MFHSEAIVLASALSLLVGPVALAVSDEDLAAIREEMDEMRNDYEARISALEARVEVAERDALQARSELAVGARAAPDVAAGPTFNPDISLILQGRAAHFGRSEGARDIPGFLMGGETGVGTEGLSLAESELDLSSNVDDLFYAFASLALNQEDGSTEIEVEGAYFQTLALPRGFKVKAGKFFSGIGYLNSKHSHAWDFVDSPLAYEAMLNTQLSEAGVQLKWVAPTDYFLELGGELFSGEGFPGAGRSRDGFGSGSLFGKVGGEVGDSHSWQAGLSWLHARPRDRESEDSAGRLYSFDGSSDVVAADFVWKWAPKGNYRERNLILQGEYLYRLEEGELAVNTEAGGGRYKGHQSGFYGQAVYQFMPQWRAGLRYDQVWSDNRFSTAGVLDDDSSSRISAMVDWSHSEFSRLRLQFSHDLGGIGTDDAVFLQYIMSLGSHGAHSF